jgi:hypothetical protein
MKEHEDIVHIKILSVKYQVKETITTNFMGPVRKCVIFFNVNLINSLITARRLQIGWPGVGTR